MTPKTDDNKIRIAQVVGNASTGGVISCVLNFYRHIDRDRFAFDFFTYGPSPFDDEIRSLGGEIYHIPNVINPFFSVPAMIRLFARGKYDIVHAHMTTLSVVPLFAAALARVHVRICHSHSTTNDGEKVKPIKDFLRHFSRLFATNYAGCSELSCNWLYGTHCHAFILHNAIDTTRFANDPSKKGAAKAALGLTGKAVVGFVGRFVYQKNVPFLVEAFSELLKMKSDCALVLVGDGAERELVTNKIQELGLEDSVHILNETRDVENIYRAFDAFALPSQYEGLPLVAVEAQSIGVPCMLSTNITHETDMGGVTHYLPIENPKDWADAMLDLLTFEPPFIVPTRLEGTCYDVQVEALALAAYYEKVLNKKA